MKLQHIDFNGADSLFVRRFAEEWRELERVLKRMPLHLKASDQRGIQGSLIFDPVGTNEYIKREMGRLGWHANIAIPKEYAFMGIGVDFLKPGLLVEVQFSNYPFFLNNTIRSELFYQSKLLLDGAPLQALVVITKAKMFPASNSTLYFEQSAKQLGGLAKFDVLDVPIRLVGLFEDEGATVKSKFTEYHATRYSRTVVKREDRRCKILRGKTDKSRCRLLWA
jgi:hypothetical protein